MSKKDKQEEEAVSEVCSECKYCEKPNGLHPQRGWCSNPKSPRFDGYVYKGETCNKFKGLRGKVKSGKSTTVVDTSKKADKQGDSDQDL